MFSVSCSVNMITDGLVFPCPQVDYSRIIQPRFSLCGKVFSVRDAARCVSTNEESCM